MSVFYDIFSGVLVMGVGVFLGLGILCLLRQVDIELMFVVVDLNVFVGGLYEFGCIGIILFFVVDVEVYWSVVLKVMVDYGCDIIILGLEVEVKVLVLVVDVWVKDGICVFVLVLDVFEYGFDKGKFLFCVKVCGLLILVILQFNSVDDLDVWDGGYFCVVKFCILCGVCGVSYLVNVIELVQIWVEIYCDYGFCVVQ